MPVRSLNSAVLKWPEQAAVLNKTKQWAILEGERNKNIKNIYCFGSVVSRNWGVGSDLDILIEVNTSKMSFPLRGLKCDTSRIPVPVEIMVYTTEELNKMQAEKRRFAKEFENNSMLLYAGK